MLCRLVWNLRFSRSKAESPGQPRALPSPLPGLAKREGHHPAGGTILQIPCSCASGRILLMYASGLLNSSSVGRKTGASGTELMSTSSFWCTVLLRKAWLKSSFSSLVSGSSCRCRRPAPSRLLRRDGAGEIGAARLAIFFAGGADVVAAGAAVVAVAAGAAGAAGALGAALADGADAVTPALLPPTAGAALASTAAAEGAEGSTGASTAVAATTAGAGAGAVAVGKGKAAAGACCETEPILEIGRAVRATPTPPCPGEVAGAPTRDPAPCTAADPAPPFAAAKGAAADDGVPSSSLRLLLATSWRASTSPAALLLGFAFETPPLCSGCKGTGSATAAAAAAGAAGAAAAPTPSLLAVGTASTAAACAGAASAVAAAGVGTPASMSILQFVLPNALGVKELWKMEAWVREKGGEEKREEAVVWSWWCEAGRRNGVRVERSVSCALRRPLPLPALLPPSSPPIPPCLTPPHFSSPPSLSSRDEGASLSASLARVISSAVGPWPRAGATPARSESQRGRDVPKD